MHLRSPGACPSDLGDEDRAKEDLGALKTRLGGIPGGGECATSRVLQSMHHCFVLLIKKQCSG